MEKNDSETDTAIQISSLDTQPGYHGDNPIKIFLRKILQFAGIHQLPQSMRIQASTYINKSERARLTTKMLV